MSQTSSETNGLQDSAALTRERIGNPVFWEPSLAFLKFAVSFLLIGSGAFLTLVAIYAPEHPVRAVGALLLSLVAIIAGLFLWRGKRQLATQVLKLGVWTVVTMIATFTGGAHSSVVIVYPLIILMTGWLANVRAAIWIALLSSAATLAMAVAENIGYLPTPPPTAPLMRWVIMVAAFIFSASLIFYLVRSYRNRLQEVLDLGGDLSRRTQDLEVSKTELNRAQAVGNVGSWVYDIANDAIRLSTETCRIFGLPEGTEGSHDVFLTRTHAQDRDALASAWQAALKGATFDHEHRIVNHKAMRWIRQKAEFEFSGEGAPLKAVGIIQDITERKHAESRIIATKNQLQAVLDAIPDLLFEVGLDSRIYAYHSGRADLLTQPPKTFMGRLMSEVVPPDAAEVCLSAIAEAAAKGQSAGKTYTLKVPQGECCFELSVAAMNAIDGNDRRFILLARDITLRKTAEDAAKNLAFYDTLTQLPNRRLLHDRLKQAMALGSRTEQYGALLFIDLDNFKTLNDTLGHDKGDLLLQQVAQRLTTCVREGDTVARLGGDEFVVMLEGLSKFERDAATQVEIVGEKIVAALNQPHQLDAHAHHSSASIGATLFVNHQGSIDDLLKRADLAMYQAKACGRNTLRFFDPQMQADVMTRAALEADLRKAIQEQQFILHYQAQVNGEGCLTGAEALVRWQHPARGLLPPLEFIPMAEETGLILPLSRWVLETACAQLALWAAQPTTAKLTLSVNVSARQFHHPEFVAQVLAILEHTGAKPQRLKLELTESLLIDDIDGVVTTMTALQARGVAFSLDDFGTGYSSLSYLKRLPLDQLKIDQGFVRDILTDSNDAAIAGMIIALAQSLGISVIAEGVETGQQQTFLATRGCHAYQGFLYGHPVPVETLEAAIKPIASSISACRAKAGCQPAWTDRASVRHLPAQETQDSLSDAALLS